MVQPDLRGIVAIDMCCVLTCAAWKWKIMSYLLLQTISCAAFGCDILVDDESVMWVNKFVYELLQFYPILAILNWVYCCTILIQLLS